MKMESKVVFVTGTAAGFKSSGPSIGSAIVFKIASEG